MTHMLHRTGTRESLSEDYAFLMLVAKGVNNENSGPKLRRFWEICLKHQPVSLGDVKQGNTYTVGNQHLMDNVNQDGSAVHAVFDKEENAAAALKEVKQAELGLSLVVSGLFDRTKEHCAKAGFQPHALLYSLGVWGKTEKLPPPKVMDITTMCGHGMIPAALVEKLAKDIKADRTTAQDASAELAKICCCGIVNITRCTQLFTELANSL